MLQRFANIPKALVWFVVVYVFAFFWLAYRRYSYFRCDAGDFALFNNMLWWTVHGRPFYASALGFSNFGIHASFLWIQLLPLYWLLPGVGTLIFAQSLFLGLCAVPVYLIAKKLLGDTRPAICCAVAFLFLPPIVSQHVNQIEEPSFLAVYLPFAYYFFLERRFGAFLIFAFISCLGRENVSLAVAMLGVAALVEKRPIKWIISPLLLGIIYFSLVTFVVMPWFRNGFRWHVMSMFSYLGETPSAIIKTALTNPGLILDHVFSAQNIEYFVLLVQPMGWIAPFFSSACLMALPDLAINLISSNTAMKVVPWHYNVVTGIFLFIGTIGAIGKVDALLRRRWGGNGYATLLGGALVILSVTHWFVWLQPSQFQPLPHHTSLQGALAAVPPGKSVIVPMRMQGHVSDREWYAQNNYFVEKPAFARQFEYVVLDAHERQYPPLITQEFFDSFYRSVDYEMIFSENGVFVFRRRGGESDWKENPWQGVR